MYPRSAILASTLFRRSSASRGFWNGFSLLGDCGRPASSAESSSVRFLAALAKNVCAAAWTPTAVWPSTVP